MITLRQNPSAHGMVQRILGHKSLHSTMEYYSGLETADALERYDDFVAAERGRKEKREQK